MIIIINTAEIFEKNIKKVALNHNGISELFEYKVGDKYFIEIPKGWSVNENNQKDEGVTFSLDFSDNNIINGRVIIQDYASLASLRNSVIDNKVIIDEYHQTYNKREWSILQLKNKNGSITTSYYSRCVDDKAVSISFEKTNEDIRESMEVVFEAIILGFKDN